MPAYRTGQLALRQTEGMVTFEAEGGRMVLGAYPPASGDGRVALATVAAGIGVCEENLFLTSP